MGTIINNQLPSGGRIVVNQSGIPHDLTKLARWPLDWVETGQGYKEHFTQDDQQIVRVFRGPWTTRPEFLRYMLGYHWSQAAQVNGQGTSLQTIQPPNVNTLQAVGGSVFGNGGNVLQAGGTGSPGDIPSTSLPGLGIGATILSNLGGGGDGSGLPIGGQLVTNLDQGDPNAQLVNAQAPPQTFGILRREIPAQEPEMPWLYAYDYELAGWSGREDRNPWVFARDPNGSFFLGNDGNPIPLWKFAAFDGALAEPKTGWVGVDGNCATVAIKYGPLPYQVYSDLDLWNNKLTELARYVERDGEDEIKALPLPTGNMKFVEGPFNNTVIPEAGQTILYPTRKIVYTWHYVPDLPWAAMDFCEGCMNSAPFDVPLNIGGQTVGGFHGIGFAPHTLLMATPARYKRVPRSLTGRVLWKVMYTFWYLAYGWDHFMARDRNWYHAQVFPIGGGAPQELYPAADFKALFQPPAPSLYQSAGG